MALRFLLTMRDIIRQTVFIMNDSKAPINNRARMPEGIELISVEELASFADFVKPWLTVLDSIRHHENIKRGTVAPTVYRAPGA